VTVAIQNSTYKGWGPDRAVDGNFSTVACTDHISSSQPWWAADLGKPMDVTRVFVTNDHSDDGQLRYILCVRVKHARIVFYWSQ